MACTRDRAPGIEGLLTVDCGNSTLDCLRHDDGVRFVVERDGGADGLAKFVAERSLRRCVATTVVPEGLAGVEALLASAGVPLQVAGRDLPFPLVLDYDTPRTLGADRWLGALGAWIRHGRSVVVDCGSATTVNLIEQDGTFRGGAIAPGLRAFAAGMAAVTPSLPAPDLDAATAMPPRSTQAAIDAGVLRGWCGLVERLVADALGAACGPARVLATGGHAERLRRHSRLRALFEPDLVHAGLRALAKGPPWNC
jgi:type III pantothenate kinase